MFVRVLFWWSAANGVPSLSMFSKLVDSIGNVLDFDRLHVKQLEELHNTLVDEEKVRYGSVGDARDLLRLLESRDLNLKGFFNLLGCLGQERTVQRE